MPKKPAAAATQPQEKKKTRQRTVRRGQALFPFGVGAIMDREGESFVACSIDLWQGSEDLQEPRLQKQLKVKTLKTPKRAADRGDSDPCLPFFRFPRWLFCQTCRGMQEWRYGLTEENLFCCNQRLVPMRFVMTCAGGHLDDVPWPYWVHFGSENTQQRNCKLRNRLRFITTPGGGGLDNVWVECGACKAKKNLDGITGPDFLSRGMKVNCRGRQPWLDARDNHPPCGFVPQVVQRGATNLHFPISISAIDIPPHSDYEFRMQDTSKIRNASTYELMKKHLNNELKFQLYASGLADETGLDIEAIRNVIAADVKSQEEKDAGGPVGVPGQEESILKAQEYTAILKPVRKPFHPKSHFIKQDEDLCAYIDKLRQEAADPAYVQLAEVVAACIDRLVRVTRLREVRVLRGFTRLDPYSPGGGGRLFSTYGPDGKAVRHSDTSKYLAVDLGTDPAIPPAPGWYPAIEVFGEGIFFTLSAARIRGWLDENYLAGSRAAKLGGRCEDSFFLGRDADVTPEIVLLHTLAHLVMRQLSFTCGYGLSSLRERLYHGPGEDGEEMLGILIYTSAGDAEGTMGGLVREGEPERFVNTVIRAIWQAEWCSSDPLCGESDGQGLGSLNLAACHACSLVPETSCEVFNRLLDRALVVGNPDNPGAGYFSDVLKG